MSDRINKIKISLIGESDVGKSTIFYQYDEHEYYNDLLMTTMCDTIYSKFNYENKDFLLEIIDTPGNDRFKTITSILIKNTQIFLLIYDITNRNSFEKLDYWYKLTCLNCNNENILYSVIANKSDLYDKKIISNEEGINFAKKINAQFFEITSTSYENITKLFENIIRKYLIENRKDLLNDINNKRNEYQGKIINGKKNGFGKMNYGNGDIYEGNWKDDLRDGEGTLINNNGDKYYGIWKNDVLNEKIEIEYINGDIYQGNLKVLEQIEGKTIDFGVGQVDDNYLAIQELFFDDKRYKCPSLFESEYSEQGLKEKNYIVKNFNTLGECIVCHNNLKESVFVPCGHRCACYNCAVIVFAVTKRCPKCNKEASCIIKKIYE